MDVTPYLQRYREGEWRDGIFRDIIFDDVRPQGNCFTFLDIGCGRGFDGSVPLQEGIARVAKAFIGVEPDREIEPAPYFTEVHRCFFEEANIEPGSVNVAYSVMVLEHLPNPEQFFAKLHSVLTTRGVFWGMTVDSRHWFCRMSRLLDRLRLKDLYLTALLGDRSERYDNYPVFYRSNSPQEISRFAEAFSSCEFYNFSRVGQCSPYFPPLARPAVELWDRWAIAAGRPGTLLFVRLQK